MNIRSTLRQQLRHWKSGRYHVNLPSLGDMTFYERFANNGLKPSAKETTYEYVGWPIAPSFGMAQDEAA